MDLLVEPEDDNVWGWGKKLEVLERGVGGFRLV